MSNYALLKNELFIFSVILSVAVVVIVNFPPAPGRKYKTALKKK
jgi:hypothetical protein